jgi:hypothetical protein
LQDIEFLFRASNAIQADIEDDIRKHLEAVGITITAIAAPDNDEFNSFNNVRGLGSSCWHCSVFVNGKFRPNDQAGTALTDGLGWYVGDLAKLGAWHRHCFWVAAVWCFFWWCTLHEHALRCGARGGNVLVTTSV